MTNGCDVNVVHLVVGAIAAAVLVALCLCC